LIVALLFGIKGTEVALPIFVLLASELHSDIPPKHPGSFDLLGNLIGILDSHITIGFSLLLSAQILGILTFEKKNKNKRRKNPAIFQSKSYYFPLLHQCDSFMAPNPCQYLEVQDFSFQSS
jgi:hypothetical protein